MAIDTTLLAALVADTPTPGAYWTKARLEEQLNNFSNLQSQVSAKLTLVTTNATLTGNGTASAALSVALPLPAAGSNGEVLKVVSSVWTSAPMAALPAVTTANNTMVLTVVSGAWTANAPASGLPAIVSSVDTLALTVVSGATTATWQLRIPGATGAAGGFSSVQTIGAITANYTMLLTDAGKLLKATAAAVISVPLNASVAYPTGQHIDVTRWTTAVVTVAAISAGVTLRAPFGAKIKTQYGAATLVKMAADEWLLVGDLEAV